jgi:hypothetical protein
MVARKFGRAARNPVGVPVCFCQEAAENQAYTLDER